MKKFLLSFLLVFLIACEGPAGPTGPAGPEGPSGPAGPVGIGEPGTDGDNGEAGADGQDGQDGADGQDGTNGQDGEDGVANLVQYLVTPDHNHIATKEFPEFVGTDPNVPPFVSCYAFDGSTYWIFDTTIYFPNGHKVAQASSAPARTGWYRPPPPPPEPKPEEVRETNCYVWYNVPRERWNATAENVPINWKILFLTIY